MYSVCNHLKVKHPHAMTTQTELQIINGIFNDREWQGKRLGDGCRFQLPRSGWMACAPGKYIAIHGVVAVRIAKRMVEEGKLTAYVHSKGYDISSKWEFYIEWPFPSVGYDASSGDRIYVELSSGSTVIQVTDTYPNAIRGTVEHSGDVLHISYYDLIKNGAVYLASVAELAVIA